MSHTISPIMLRIKMKLRIALPLFCAAWPRKGLPVFRYMKFCWMEVAWGFEGGKSDSLSSLDCLCSPAKPWASIGGGAGGLVVIKSFCFPNLTPLTKSHFAPFCVLWNRLGSFFWSMRRCDSGRSLKLPLMRLAKILRKFLMTRPKMRRTIISMVQRYFFRMGLANGHVGLYCLRQALRFSI